MAMQLVVGQGVTHNRICLRKCARWSKIARAITQIGRSLTKGAKIVSNNMGVTSKRDTGDRTTEMTI